MDAEQGAPCREYCLGGGVVDRRGRDDPQRWKRPMAAGCVLCAAGNRRHPADRRSRYASGDFPFEQLFRRGCCCCWFRCGQSAADRGWRDGGCCRFDPHPGDVQRHESLLGVGAVRRSSWRFIHRLRWWWRIHQHHQLQC